MSMLDHILCLRGKKLGIGQYWSRPGGGSGFQAPFWQSWGKVDQGANLGLCLFRALSIVPLKVFFF